MKTFRKFLPIIFVLTFIVAMLVITSVTVTAESGKCGDNLTWEFDYNNNTLYISGTGDMYDYRCEDGITTAPWGEYAQYGKDHFFWDGEGILYVVIEDSVTSIGKYAFAYCGAIEKVSFRSSATSIGEYAFMTCSSLKSINMGNAVTRIERGAFYDCDELEDVTLPNSVTSIGSSAFNDCYHLEKVTIPSSVKSIGEYAFHYFHPLEWEVFPLELLTIYCYEGSYAHTYSVENGISYDFLCSHVFGSYISNNDSTCSSDGTKTAVCKKCGIEETIIDEGSASGHIFTTYVSDNNATCTKDGTQMAYCDKGCGAVDTKADIDSALGHSFTNYVSNNDATCTADGTKTAKCNRCDVTDTVTDTNSAHGHSFTSYVSDKNATCDTDGTKTAYCDNECGVFDIITDEGTMLGHSFGEWTVVTEPTLDAAGIEERVCSICSEKEQRELPKLNYEKSFTDVKESAWFYSSVEFVVSKGYMKGMSETKFSPNSNITREQFVLILANIAGVNTNEYKNIDSGFEDVKTGQWYSGAVTWAVQEGYVSGMSADKFGRGQSIQRAALARMLYNYASKNGINVDGRADLSAFGDAKDFDKAGNAWMKEPVQWAVENGIISGMTVNGKNCVNAKGTATRAQAARMLMQFDELMK